MEVFYHDHMRLRPALVMVLFTIAQLAANSQKQDTRQSGTMPKVKIAAKPDEVLDLNMYSRIRDEGFKAPTQWSMRAHSSTISDRDSLDPIIDRSAGYGLQLAEYADARLIQFSCVCKSQDYVGRASPYRLRPSVESTVTAQARLAV